MKTPPTKSYKYNSQYSKSVSVICSPETYLASSSDMTIYNNFTVDQSGTLQPFSSMNFTEVHQGNSCVNSSDLSCLRASPSGIDALLYMCVAAVVFLTVSGNLLVIISICHFKQLHTPTNFFLLSLAIADFLVGATVMPFHFIKLLDPYWCIGRLNCIMRSVSSFLTYATCVSIYSVVLIAVDRLFALGNPFLYSTKMTLKLTIRIISIVWLCALVYNTMLLYYNNNLIYITGKAACVDCFFKMTEKWATADFFVILVVPLVTIISIYLKIFAIAKKHANNITFAKKQHSQTKKVTASEKKAAKTLSILVLVFLLCLLPYFISVILYINMRKPSLHLAIVHTVSILHINSTVNPIIYALFYSWFQKSVKLILSLRICATESSLMNVLAKET